MDRVNKRRKLYDKEVRKGGLTNALLLALDELTKECNWKNFLRCVNIGFDFTLIDKKYWNNTVKKQGNAALLFGSYLIGRNNGTNFDYLLKAADLNYAAALYTVGQLIHTGIIVAQTSNIQWYHLMFKAVYKGCIFACEYMIENYPYDDFIQIYCTQKHYSYTQRKNDCAHCVAMFAVYRQSHIQQREVCLVWPLIKDRFFTSLLPKQVYLEAYTWLMVAKRLKMPRYLTQFICDTIVRNVD